MIHDAIAIGLGPFNLGFMALAESIPELRHILCLESKSEFSWHKGMLLPETTLQVPFLADFVTMADPCHRFSFLNYLKSKNRLYQFYFYENMFIPRAEYDQYGSWVSHALSSKIMFNQRVKHVVFKDGIYTVQTESGALFQSRAMVLGVGSSPVLPECAQNLKHAFHSAEFKEHIPHIKATDQILVVGSGQSAAEIVLTLLETQVKKIAWVTRSQGFLPMEYTKLGLSHFFSPDYMHMFYNLKESTKDNLINSQGLLYKGISAATINQIYDKIYHRTVAGENPLHMQPSLNLKGLQNEHLAVFSDQLTEKEVVFPFDIAIFATGYTETEKPYLNDLPLKCDQKNRLIMNKHFAYVNEDGASSKIYGQNANIFQFGVGTPDLGLGPYRNSVIINDLCQRQVYPVSEQTIFHQLSSFSG